MDGLLATSFVVDGESLIAGPLVGRDPDSVLPPLSRDLLPASVPGIAWLGRGFNLGDGSLTVVVRRQSRTVHWEPYRQAPDRTLPGPLDFALLEYLDEIDRCVEHPLLMGRSRRLARQLELALLRTDDTRGNDRGLLRAGVHVPMAWQTDDHVAVGFDGERYQFPIADLPEADDEALHHLLLVVLNAPHRLPASGG